MCELFCLSSRYPTRATLTLHAFARRGGLQGHTIDGWGLAFADGRDVRLYKEPEPAANSDWLAFIENRPVSSRLVLSHIRHATRGGLSLANTQPFARELGGRMHVFAHNGRLDRIEQGLAGTPSRFRPLGETDSEIAFCILLERLAPLWADGARPALADALAVLRRFAARMRRLGPANFLYSDGEFVVAHAHRRIQADGTVAPPGLWRLHRRCAVDADALAPAGARKGAVDAPQEITLLASVPLTDEDWHPLDEGEILVIGEGRRQELPVVRPAGGR